MSSTSSLLVMPSWSEDARLGVKIVNVDRVARTVGAIELCVDGSGDGSPPRHSRWSDVDPSTHCRRIVSAATLATSPLIKGDALRPGMHVDLIGAFRPEMREADGAAFARSQVFVDTYEGAMEETGVGAALEDLAAAELVFERWSQSRA